MSKTSIPQAQAPVPESWVEKVMEMGEAEEAALVSRQKMKLIQSKGWVSPEVKMAKDCQDCFTLTEVKKAKVLQTVRPVNFHGVKQAKVFQTSLRVPLSNFSYQASAVLPRIRI